MANVVVWKLGPAGALEAVAITPEPVKLDDASERLPGGAYTTFRTFDDNRILHLQQHFDRLAETAQLARRPVRLDVTAVRAGLRRAVALFPSVDKRVRVTVDLEENPGDVYLAIETLKVPAAELYREGVAVVTRRLKRTNPKAKLTGFLAVASEVRQELPADVNEAILIDENERVLEGLTSNFFAVKNSELWTVDEGVLSGITRSVVLEEAQKEGLRVHFEGIRAAQLPGLDEAFITSSSRAVLPVTRIDGRVVGGGKPGPVTRLLLADYNRRIEAEIEPI